MASVTAVACSAALPMIGKRIRPTNSALRPPSMTASILLTINSAQSAIIIVEITSSIIICNLGSSGLLFSDGIVVFADVLVGIASGWFSPGIPEVPVFFPSNS